MMKNEKVHIDKYFLQETKGWIRELDFFLSELSFLKTRLAYIVDSANDKKLIAIAEKFHNDFLNHDEQIKNIKASVLVHENNLEKQKETPAKSKVKSADTQGVVRKQVASIEFDFIALKSNFNSFALSSLKRI